MSSSSSNQKRFRFFLITAVLWIQILLLCSSSMTCCFAFQQQIDGERIWTPPTTTVTSHSALPKPPFPNGACGGQVLVIPGLFDNDKQKMKNPNSIMSLTLTPRDVTIWLPPHYHSNKLDKSERFSVLYCHDGQNVINDESSWTGTSWRLTGALMRLSEHGLLRGPPPIVVLMPSAQGDVIPGIRRRHLEYGSLTIMPSLAQAHADMVANVIKPFIDDNFRTNPNCASVMGSSMGGQASINLLLRHSNVFSAAACLSPYFAPDTLAAVGLSLPKLRKKRIYMDMGGDVNDVKVPWLDVMDHITTKHWWNAGYFWLDTSLQPNCHAMYQILQFGAGASGTRGGAQQSDNDDVVKVHFEQIPGARHNERAWANRIHQPLLYLYGK